MKKYDQHKMKRTQIREDQKEQGMFDGRYSTRVEIPKNLYNRKAKHKQQQFNFY